MSCATLLPERSQERRAGTSRLHSAAKRACDTIEDETGVANLIWAMC
jgi:hypothetical protein